MANSWFRFYAESLNDPKVQKLPAEAFKIWVNMLCMACASDTRNGDIGTIEDVTFALRETKETVSSAFHALESEGLIVTIGETLHKKIRIKNWAKRQYKSDVSTERVREFRKRNMERSCNVTETPPDTDTDTDTDTEQKESKTPYSPPLPDWLPSVEWEAFLEMRKKIKKPPTEHAKTLLVKKLTEFRRLGHDPTAIIEQSIRNSWQDLFPPRQQTRNYAEQREENRRLERSRVGI